MRFFWHLFRLPAPIGFVVCHIRADKLTMTTHQTIKRVNSVASPTPEDSVAILKEAKVILRYAQSWTIRYYARTSDDKPVSALDSNAAKFSLMGAVRRASHELGFDKDTEEQCRGWLRLAIDQYCRQAVQCTPRSVEDFNDTRRRKHGEVLQVLDYAIEIGESNLVKEGRRKRCLTVPHETLPGRYRPLETGIPMKHFDAVKKEALKYALKDAVYVVMCFVPIALVVLGLIIGLASLFK